MSNTEHANEDFILFTQSESLTACIDKLLDVLDVVDASRKAGHTASDWVRTRMKEIGGRLVTYADEIVEAASQPDEIPF